MKLDSFIYATVLAASAAADAMVGTNIGGWMVLEPWITPTFFYRFLSKKHSEGVGMDCWTVCEALGPEEGNAMMRAHWDAWVTEDHIKQLAERDVEIVRLPIGDWSITPYGPYIGCMDGAAEKIDWFLDTAAKYGLKVLLDVHAVKDSQNGFDNSGKASDLVWTDENHFKHWSIENASWLGHFNAQEYRYDSINQENIDWSIQVVSDMMARWGNHPAVYAFEPVNEPWWASDFPALKGFYRRARNVVREANPDLVFVFHDAFTPRADTWNDLFEDDDIGNVAMDTHAYMAWWEHKNDIPMYCDDYRKVLTTDDILNVKYPVWVGEWALATDVCAMWLGGFNDSNTSYQFDCNWVDCPYTYLPEPFKFDMDREAAMLGPIGESDRSAIRYGKCPIDSTWFTSSNVQTLAECTREVFDEHYGAQFMWNFRNELEVKWSYLEAYNIGWLNFGKSRQFLN